jgi:hypothetical protein
MDTGAYAEIRHRDDEDQYQRDHQQPASGALLQDAIIRYPSRTHMPFVRPVWPNALGARSPVAVRTALTLT